MRQAPIRVAVIRDLVWPPRRIRGRDTAAEVSGHCRQSQSALARCAPEGRNAEWRKQAQTIGVGGPCLPSGARQGPRPVRLDDDRCRVDDRLRHFYRFRRYRPPGAKPRPALVVWLAAGVMTLIGALSYGELAAAMPHAGGQYVYLRESLGPIWGFLYGWTMLLVIQTATIAAVAIAFAKFTAVIVPWFSASRLDLENRHVRSLAILVRRARALQRRPEPAESARDSFDRFSHLGQHARVAIRQNRAEYFTVTKALFARGAGDSRVLVFHFCGPRPRTSATSGAMPVFP